MQSHSLDDAKQCGHTLTNFSSMLQPASAIAVSLPRLRRCVLLLCKGEYDLSMKRRSFPLLFAAAPFTLAHAGEEALTGAALQTAVSGRTVYINTPMGEVPIRYSKNGSVSGHTELAVLNGESTTRDHGRWWVSQNKLCIRWQNWMSGATHCFTMHRVGPWVVRWRREDGKSGLARLG